MPADLSAGQVAGRVAVNAVKIGTGFGLFNGAVSVSELAFGGNLSTSNTTTTGTQSKSQSQGSKAKSQSSSSLLGNYSLSTYLNTAVDSFAGYRSSGWNIGYCFWCI